MEDLMTGKNNVFMRLVNLLKMIFLLPVYIFFWFVKLKGKTKEDIILLAVVGFIVVVTLGWWLI